MKKKPKKKPPMKLTLIQRARIRPWIQLVAIHADPAPRVGSVGFSIKAGRIRGPGPDKPPLFPTRRGRLTLREQLLVFSPPVCSSKNLTSSRLLREANPPLVVSVAIVQDFAVRRTTFVPSKAVSQNRMAQGSRMRLVSLLLVVGSFQVDVVAACGGEERANYRLEFQGLWTERTFPKSFPKYRKNAQWSTLIGLSHNDQYSMWEPGELASVPFKDFAEGEDASGKELQTEIVSLPSGSVFAGKSLRSGTGRSVATVFAHRDYSKVSFAVGLIPSPDWFVGVAGLELCEGGSWRRDPVHLDLQPWDAGTDGGFSFTSPDYVSDPQEPISRISAQYPDHPANSFFYPKLARLPPIARVTLVWQPAGNGHNSWLDKLAPATTTELGKPGRWHPGEDVQMPGDSPEHVSPGVDLPTEPEVVIPYDCEVTPWGSWSPCDTLCKVGLRRRFRVIIQRPKNGGQDCPALIGVQACQAKLTKPQKKCSKARIKKETKKYMKIQRRNYMGKKKRNRFIT